MEKILKNEMILTDSCLEITPTNGCIDDSSCVESGTIIPEVGIFKVFKNIIYNQLEVDPYSCFVVGPYTALSNLTGQSISYDLMRFTINRLKKDGKFTPGVGGYLSDGVRYVCEDFNMRTGLNVKYAQIPLTPDTIIQSLKNGSPISTGIKYGANYFKNEQDDGIVQESMGTLGNKGHCITIVKANTTDDKIGMQIKFVENYNGVLKYNIIYVRFDQLRSLFFNTGFTYSL